MSLAVLGGLIGSVSFSGSLIAFGKLQGLIKRSLRFRGQQTINMMLLVIALVAGGFIALDINASMNIVVVFFALALVLGITMTLPIGGADMPVVSCVIPSLLFDEVSLVKSEGPFPNPPISPSPLAKQ